MRVISSKEPGAQKMFHKLFFFNGGMNHSICASFYVRMCWSLSLSIPQITLLHFHPQLTPFSIFLILVTGIIYIISGSKAQCFKESHLLDFYSLASGDETRKRWSSWDEPPGWEMCVTQCPVWCRHWCPGKG